MKKLLLLSMAVSLVFLGAFSQSAFSDATPDKSGDLTIPWDEFKSLLNLGEDQIVIPLETFQKLLIQTGVPTPPHSVLGGMIVMTQEEFSNLVNKMQPPLTATSPPPFDYLITKAHYSGEMHESGTSFTGFFLVHILKKGDFVKVPILPVSMALENVTVNGHQSLVVAENGSHQIILSGAGEYQVKVYFSVMSKLEDGPGRIDLSILPTPITLLTLNIPLTDIDIEIPQAQKVAITKTDSASKVTAVISQGTSISVLWHKAPAPTEKVPPKIYSQLDYLVSIEDDALSIDADITLNVLHSEISELQLRVPGGINILTVSGDGIGDWTERTIDDEHRVVVPFTYGLKGNVRIHLTAEAPLSESGLNNQLSGLEIPGAVRETGFIGIELNTSGEVSVVSDTGLEPVAVQKLPDLVTTKSQKPLMFGFKYLKHPFELVLDVKKHKKVAVPVATINSANAVSLFTEDGKIVHRLVYQVRNNAKQFLEFQLPPTADVWSIFVDGKPVECSMNDEGMLLVPLIRSRVEGNGLGTFPVELIYCVVNDHFSLTGIRQSTLPAVDLLISQIIWSVYLPNDYAYLHFNSTLEIEEMIRGINILSHDTRNYNDEAMRELAKTSPGAALRQDADQLKKAYEGKDYKSEFRNLPMEGSQIAGQLNAELEFSGRLEATADKGASGYAAGGSQSIGVLPIQIRIPTGGQVYRFARTIIRPEDALSMSVTYGRNWVMSAARWLFWLLIILLAWLSRKRLIKPLQIVGRHLKIAWTYIRNHREAMAQFCQSPLAIIVVSGVMIASWFVSLVLFLPVFLVFWICTANQAVIFWKKRAGKRERARGAMREQSI